LNTPNDSALDVPTSVQNWSIRNCSASVPRNVILVWIVDDVTDDPVAAAFPSLDVVVVAAAVDDVGGTTPVMRIATDDGENNAATPSSVWANYKMDHTNVLMSQ
jgi:hypothetical protein